MSTGPAISPSEAVGVLLVRADGSVLLQHRDAHAPIGPNRWAFIAGAREPGESPVKAALRELREETGFQLDMEPALFFRGPRPRSSGAGTTSWHVYYASSCLTDADVVVGEGREIRFVARSDIAALPLTISAEFFLSRFLKSPEYETCVHAARAL